MTAGLEEPIDLLLTALVDADGPGVAVGVYRDGQLVASASQGLASLEYGVPITSGTRFDLASVSMQMTAAAALLLHRDGVVDLDADLRNWLPEVRLEGITLRGCLQHTTGLRDYTEVNLLRGGSLADMAGQHQFLDWLSATDSTSFPPGTDISYCNSGYVAAAIALSRAVGRPFAQLMHERVFGPLGMDDVRLHDAVGLVVPGMAYSYLPAELAGYLRQEMAEEQVGDGGVLAAVDDLAGWHGFLLDGRGLGADIRRLLIEPAGLADDRRARYACGVARQRVDGHDALAHGGSMYAFSSYLVSVPSAGLGVTVLSNRGGIDVQAVAVDVLRLCLPDRPAALRTPAAVATPPADRTWFCSATNESAQSASQPDGALVLSTGYESVTLTWGGAAWETPDGLLRVVPGHEGELQLEDWLGRIRRYLPASAEPAAAPPDAPAVYRSGELGNVRLDRDGTTTLLSVGRRSLVVEWVASYAGDDVYRAPGKHPVWVRRHREDGALSLSCGSSVFRALPSVAPPPSTAGPTVNQSGDSPAAQPIPR
jgi:CubicO group peptidase (beta-lactamase class C family)